jgi:D-alanyl-D-alanine carboxypeptidase
MAMKSAGRLSRVLVGALATLAAAAFISPALAEDRYAAIVMDARTGEVLHEEQADANRYPASLTKMMTLYMLFEAIERGDLSMNTTLRASRNASRQPPSRLGLRCSRRRGCDSITVSQAIRALVVQSANDVATMVAERLGGTEARFAANMTARARELGMTDTRFANASGLPDNRHRTTARDMAILLWNDFPEHYHVFQTPSFAWRRGSGRNHNRLLGQVEGVDGIKTGYTRASGFNLATMAERNGRRIIVVVLGGESASARDAQVTYLIEGAYEEYARREDPNAAQLASLPLRRLDAREAPNSSRTMTASAPAPSPARPLPPSSPYDVYRGMVTQTGAAATGPVDPTSQGDEGDDDDDEVEIPTDPDMSTEEPE